MPGAYDAKDPDSKIAPTEELHLREAFRMS